MLTHLTDFPDRLSPMLVKELRQGMRARSFTLLFLGFQGLLAFILLTAGAAADWDDAGSFASGVIFTLFAGAALFIQPMRGVSALSSEITGNTIEMMVLTRLSAWRIVFGKWIAIVSQTALILVSIIPYLILRYFFGGMLLVGEMVFLALIFLTSMALTAVMVGLSGNSTKLVRLLPVIAILFLMNFIPRFLFRGGFNEFMAACSLSDWTSIVGILTYVSFITYVGWCALSHGTSVIAPVAENHSTIRRVIALGLTLIAVAVGFHDDVDPSLMPVIFSIILAPAVVTALTEPSILLPPIFKPFLKRGLPGRLAGVVLVPGWPSGVFFTSLLLAISAAGITSAWYSATRQYFDSETAVICLGLVGGILLPALLAAKFSKQESRRFTNFMIFLLALILLALIPMIFTSIKNTEQYLWLFIWNPLIFLPMLDERTFSHSDLLLAACVVDLIILSLLLATAFFAYRGYGEIIREAREKPAEP